MGRVDSEGLNNPLRGYTQLSKEVETQAQAF